MFERIEFRPVDVGLISIFIGGSQYLLTTATAKTDGGGVTPVWVQQAAGYVFAVIAAIFLYYSYSKSEWISTMHTTHNITPGTAVRHVRKVGRKLPCPYPDAWYAVGLTEEVKPGMVVPATVCGHNLIVFRPQATRENPIPKPAVLDAYCSHLGAHLALGGGQVRGDCVRCPFHGWCFGTDGTLRSVPTADTPPTGAGTSITSWPCKEQNGVISVWMNSRMHLPKFAQEAGIKSAEASCSHGESSSSSTTTTKPAAAAAATNPTITEATALASRASTLTLPNNDSWFDIPVFPQVNGPDRAYVYHGYTENIVNAVLFEIPENGSDVCHLHVLHREFIIPALYPFLSHKWNASWNASDENTRPGSPGYIANITVDEQMCMMDYPLPGEVKVQIKQCGPSQVYLDMMTPVGPVMIVETVSPVAPQQLRVLHAIYAGKWVPRLVAKAILYSTVVQFEKDVPIWCNKKYLPLGSPGAQLVSADSSIKVYRNWVRRFWENDKSISFEQAAKQHACDSMGFPADASTAALRW